MIEVINLNYARIVAQEAPPPEDLCPNNASLLCVYDHDGSRLIVSPEAGTHAEVPQTELLERLAQLEAQLESASGGAYKETQELLPILPNGYCRGQAGSCLTVNGQVVFPANLIEIGDGQYYPSVQIGGYIPREVPLSLFVQALDQVGLVAPAQPINAAQAQEITVATEEAGYTEFALPANPTAMPNSRMAGSSKNHETSSQQLEEASQTQTQEQTPLNDTVLPAAIASALALLCVSTYMIGDWFYSAQRTAKKEHTRTDTTWKPGQKDEERVYLPIDGYQRPETQEQRQQKHLQRENQGPLKEPPIPMPTIHRVLSVFRSQQPDTSRMTPPYPGWLYSLIKHKSDPYGPGSNKSVKNGVTYIWPWDNKNPNNRYGENPPHRREPHNKKGGL